MKHLKFKTYLKFIENSLDSTLFRNSFVEDNDEVKNILEDGNLSCAFYISCILKIFDLISQVHATVSGTIEDLKSNGWYEIDNPRLGSILIWEKSEINNGHRHIGFYFGNDLAISNSSQDRKIAKHDWAYDGKRKVEMILWNNELND